MAIAQCLFDLSLLTGAHGTCPSSLLRKHLPAVPKVVAVQAVRAVVAAAHLFSTLAPLAVLPGPRWLTLAVVTLRSAPLLLSVQSLFQSLHYGRTSLYAMAMYWRHSNTTVSHPSFCRIPDEHYLYSSATFGQTPLWLGRCCRKAIAVLLQPHSSTHAHHCTDVDEYIAISLHATCFRKYVSGVLGSGMVFVKGMTEAGDG